MTLLEHSAPRETALYDSQTAPAVNHEFMDAQETLLSPATLRHIGEQTLVAANSEPVDREKVFEQFETKGYVARAPHFKDQFDDPSRLASVTSLTGMTSTKGAYTETLTQERITTTEHQAIQEIATFLGQISERSSDQRDRDTAAKMLDRMTFIGEKEYDEAAAGIAAYWKAILDHDPDQNLVVLTGIESKQVVKSDTFLFDAILSKFSDEEINHYHERLTLNPDTILSEPEDTRVVMLDDWVIEGIQLGEQYHKYTQQYQNYVDSMEVQLLVAPQERLDDGLYAESPGFGAAMASEAPVKAYYVTDFETEDAITGYHSSSDHYFDETVALMAKRANIPMPAGTNIIRPYRQPGYEPQNIRRLKTA